MDGPDTLSKNLENRDISYILLSLGKDLQCILLKDNYRQMVATLLASESEKFSIVQFKLQTELFSLLTGFSKGCV